MKPAARRRARRMALQAIYSWQLSNNAMSEIEVNYLTEQDIEKIDVPYFQDLVRGVAKSVSTLDAALAPFTTRPFDELDQVERAILRLSAYELQARLDVPYKVVMNEAIELAKAFGAEDSHRFVNGVLDKAIESLRVVRQ